MEDADEPVGQPASASLCSMSAGARGVVERAGAGRGGECGEGLRPERVDEPVVADEPGSDDLLLARGAGDRAGRRRSSGGPCCGVAMRVVAELCRAPGRRGSRPCRAGPVDLSVRVRPKCASTCPCRAAACAFRVGRRDRDRGAAAAVTQALAQLRAAQRGQDRPAWPASCGGGRAEHRRDLRRVSFPAPGSATFIIQRAGASRSSNAASAAGKYHHSSAAAPPATA